MSLLDDWEDNNNVYDPQAQLQVNVAPSTSVVQPQPGGGHAPSNNSPDEQPMFTLDKVEFKPNGLTRMVVCNNILAMALSNCHVIRLNLQKPEDLEDIEISRKPEDRIHKLFMDPSGNHLIIAMETEENYYLNLKWKKPKPLPKMKGILIESVAWDKQCDPLFTKEMLIGTNKGRIYETVIEAPANEKQFLGLVGANTKEHIFKPVYNLGENMMITGLKFEKFVASSVNEPVKYFVLCTTPTRIYQFIGGPSFEQLFSQYETNAGFQELPGEMQNSSLQFFSKYAQGLPKSFGWLTSPGVYYGDLIFGSQNPGDSVLTDTSLLPYPSNTRTTSVGGGAGGGGKGGAAPVEYVLPIGLALTEFHFVLLYADRIQAISTLSQEVLWEETFQKWQRIGKVRGIATDIMAKTTWIYADFAVFELVITNEDRHVWKMKLEKQQYEAALQYCKTPAQRDKVWSQQADHYFKDQNYKLAASYYGKTQRSFEEISLKFLNINEQNALQVYLLHKLEHIKQSKHQDATQMTLISTWLTEIYLDKLNQCEAGGGPPPLTLSSPRSATGAPLSPRMTSMVDKERLDVLKEEFEQFLKDYKDHLDKNTTFQLISSHGRVDEMLFYATVIEDWDRVISHHLHHADYVKALDVITKQTHEELYYKYCGELMHWIPERTVNAWMRAHVQGPKLEPKLLIPALMRYNPQNNPPEDPHTNQSIRYLQYCVRNLGSKEPAIHNLLLSLYAKEKDEAPLLKFLNQPERYYDVKYALRLALEENKTSACVLLYSQMGMYEDAVELALKVDVELAKLHADKPLDDDEPLRKKLWLKIARYIVEEKGNIKQAMELLTQCDLLKIEDILPFFPDFTHIDAFKNEITSSLEDYNRHIEELKIEMEEATRSADLIRMDIKNLRNKYGHVSGSQSCQVCQLPALSRAFYLFPCEHVFHADCLRTQMMDHLDVVQKNRVYELTQKIQQVQSGSNNSSTSVVASPTLSAAGKKQKKGAPATAASQKTLAASATTDPDKEQINIVESKLHKLKEELDDIIANECLYCGDIMIRSIADPFVRPQDDAELRSWAI